LEETIFIVILFLPIFPLYIEEIIYSIFTSSEALQNNGNMHTTNNNDILFIKLTPAQMRFLQ
ncbi:hypothetical protein EAY67_21815, partial [Salmonella enterica]|nr:hypothetical protein [Salmonella enterica]